MTSFKTLLAKSSRHSGSSGQVESLFGHTSAVLDFASPLTNRLADPLQSLLGLESSDTDLWKRAVQVAAWIEMAIPIPIPRGDAWREWEKVNRFYVAPAGSLSYDDFRGAEWR